MPNYEDIKLPKETRANNNTCNCYICITARYYGHPKAKLGRGFKRQASRNIGAFRLYGASKIVNLPKNQSIFVKSAFMKWVKIKIILVALPQKLVRIYYNWFKNFLISSNSKSPVQL